MLTELGPLGATVHGKKNGWGVTRLTVEGRKTTLVRKEAFLLQRSLYLALFCVGGELIQSSARVILLDEMKLCQLLRKKHWSSLGFTEINRGLWSKNSTRKRWDLIISYPCLWRDDSCLGRSPKPFAPLHPLKGLPRRRPCKSPERTKPNPAGLSAETVVFLWWNLVLGDEILKLLSLDASIPMFED